MIIFLYSNTFLSAFLSLFLSTYVSAGRSPAAIAITIAIGGAGGIFLGAKALKEGRDASQFSHFLDRRLICSECYLLLITAKQGPSNPIPTLILSYHSALLH